MAELAVLAGEVEVVRAGWLRVVLVEGPAGIGKTRLLRSFTEAHAFATVLRRSGAEAEQAIGFGVLEQVVRSVDTGWAAELRTTAYEAPVAGLRLAEILRTVCERGPLLLVIDDAHWVDQPSLQAVGVALRRLRDAPVLAIVCGRDDPSAARDRLGRIAADLDGTRMGLEGLTTGEVADLAEVVGAGRLPAAAAGRLRDHTGGSPLHARALLGEVATRELCTLDRPLPAPASYAMLVIGRLTACSAGARALVNAAAVLGDRAPWHVIQRVVGDVAGLAELDEIRAANLMEVDTSSAETLVSFDHPLTRMAIYHDLSLQRRTELHRAAAACGEDAGDPLNHRVRATLGRDAALAGELAARAAQDVERGDPLAAGARLLSASHMHDDPAERGRLLLDAVELTLLGGDGARACALAAELDDADDTVRRDHVRGLTSFADGRFAEAETLLVSAWEAADDQLAPRIAGSLCHLLYLLLRTEEAVLWGERASGSDRTAPFLPTSRAFAGRLGAHADPVAVPHAGVPRAQGLLARGSERLWTDDLSGAREDLQEAVSGLRDRGLFSTGLHALMYLSIAEFRLGAWDDAIEHAADAVSLAAGADQAWLLARLHGIAIMPLAARGRFADAERHALAGVAVARSTGLPLDVAGITIARANIAAARGEHQTVIDTLGPLVGSGAHQRTGEPGVSVWPCLHADALGALGRATEARDVLAPYEALAAERGRRSAIAEAARVRGNLEAAAGHDEAARGAFAQALEHAAQPFSRALAQAAQGAHLRRMGRRRDAATALGAAHGILVDLKAEPYAQRCARELAACGLRPSGRRDRDRDRLTPRERTVAALAAGGASNREIAAELVVSLNTVEFHMRNVFAKLGVSARSDLAGRI